MANSKKYADLHLGAKDLLRAVEDVMAADLGNSDHWSEHELAPVRSSLVHVEWLLGGGLDADAGDA